MKTWNCDYSEVTKQELESQKAQIFTVLDELALGLHGGPDAELIADFVSDLKEIDGLLKTAKE
jgi:hypothetical protein